MQTINKICVIGAGTMGAGIAQVCAQKGFYTLLFDINEAGLVKAKTDIEKAFQMLVEKEKLTEEERENAIHRIQYLNDMNLCVADLFIEAIVEKVEAKVALFNQLAEINHSETIFASNTSSLSISTIQAAVQNPARVVGMHFFNPAPVMKLVEVVKGSQTDETVAATLMELCKQLQKTAVLCTDAPGFIVNRVARHYYLQAMHEVEQGNVSIADADALLEATGFKMGPFKLMDLIGMDINLAVSQSLYDSFKEEPRFKPSNLQIEKVAAGDLGKKTGKGFYNYA